MAHGKELKETHTGGIINFCIEINSDSLLSLPQPPQPLRLGMSNPLDIKLPVLSHNRPVTCFSTLWKHLSLVRVGSHSGHHRPSCQLELFKINRNLTGLIQNSVGLWKTSNPNPNPNPKPAAALYGSEFSQPYKNSLWLMAPSLSLHPFYSIF